MSLDWTTKSNLIAYYALFKSSVFLFACYSFVEEDLFCNLLPLFSSQFMCFILRSKTWAGLPNQIYTISCSTNCCAVFNNPISCKILKFRVAINIEVLIFAWKYLIPQSQTRSNYLKVNIFREKLTNVISGQNQIPNKEELFES